jgi:hypothetical protein
MVLRTAWRQRRAAEHRQAKPDVGAMRRITAAIAIGDGAVVLDLIVVNRRFAIARRSCRTAERNLAQESRFEDPLR